MATPSKSASALLARFKGKRSSGKKARKRKWGAKSLEKSQLSIADLGQNMQQVKKKLRLGRTDPEADLRGRSDSWRFADLNAAIKLTKPRQGEPLHIKDCRMICQMAYKLTYAELLSATGEEKKGWTGQSLDDLVERHVDTVSILTGYSKPKVRDVLAAHNIHSKTYKESDASMAETYSKLVAKRAAIPSRKFNGIPRSRYAEVVACVDDVLARNGRATRLSDIRQAVQCKLNIYINSPDFGLFLRRLGFNYDKPTRHVMKMTKKRLKRIRKYLKKYARALEEEKNGKAVIIYLDETYIHASHCRHKLWFNTKEQNVGMDQKSNRLIIIHAMSKHGLLCSRSMTPTTPMPTGQGNPILSAAARAEAAAGAEDAVSFETASTEQLEPRDHPLDTRPYNESKTCNLQENMRSDTVNTNTEFIYAAGKTKDSDTNAGMPQQGDYHNNMDGVMFMNWVKTRLEPAFIACFGVSKKMIMILDNASYHHGPEEESIHINSITKNSMYPWYDKFAMNNITITRGGTQNTVERHDQKKKRNAKEIKSVRSRAEKKTMEERAEYFMERGLFGEMQLQEIKAAFTEDLAEMHGIRGQEYKRIKRNKEEMLDILSGNTYREAGTQGHAAANYNGATFPAWPDGPSAQEMRDALEAVVKVQQPDLLHSALENWARQSRLTVELIFTPPYCPDLQPIEMIWGLVKNRVAADWFENRSMKQVLDHLFNAFYGGPKAMRTDECWTPVDARACWLRIRKCFHAANARIKRDPYLSGTIHALHLNEEQDIAEEDRDDYVEPADNSGVLVDDLQDNEGLDNEIDEDGIEHPLDRSYSTEAMTIMTAAASC